MNGADMTEPCLDQIHAKCWFEGAGLAKTVLGTWIWAVCSGAAFSEAFLVTESYSPQLFQNSTSRGQSQPDKDRWFPLGSCRPIHKIADQVDREGMKNRNWCPRT